MSSPIRYRSPTIEELRLSILQDTYRTDPVKWVNDVLGEELWSKQREIMYSVRDNRRTAVPSCHSAGKSFIAARIIAWWLSVHPIGEARVITSAPTGDQVKAILWQELSRAHSLGRLPGRLNQTEWWMQIGNREEMVGIGRKPSEHNPAAFQGIHERYVLLVFDEASGIPQSLWVAGDGLLSNTECRLLSIGNPDDSLSEFAKECQPGSGTNVIHISAFDTPNFTGEEISEHARHRLVSPIWVEEKKHKWGEDNPFYISKVLGKFPENRTDALIPFQWIRDAQNRSLPESKPVELGIDVGGGGDKNVVAVRRGPVVRIIRRDHNPDTMKSLSNVLEDIKTTNAVSAKVDKIGIGWGIVDRAQEIASDQRLMQTDPETCKRADLIVGINVGEKAEDSESFMNLRAEGFWGLRERFQEGSIDIDDKDDDLAAQLARIKYKRTTGRIQIESKDEMKRRGEKSPDDAEAVMLSFIKKKWDPYSGGLTWGR